MQDYLQSRFFSIDDQSTKSFIFDLPKSWWSRFYEYEWAKNFCRDDDVVLDAACGICHPLKFYLLDHCKEVHACDMDERILDKEYILLEIKEVFGESASDNLPRRYLENINYKRTIINHLPYEDKKFNKIYCISVLEHLEDKANQNPAILGILEIREVFKTDIYYSLKEFKRTLRNDGMIVLTFDFPSINLQYLKYIVEDLSLEFAADVSFNIPQNALYSKEQNLFCYRAVLKKKI